MKDFFEDFCKALLLEPSEKIWSDGEEILCNSSDGAEAIADLLEILYRSEDSNIVVNTGYYDPAEDMESGEENDHTGWYYVHVDGT